MDTIKRNHLKQAESCAIVTSCEFFLGIFLGLLVFLMFPSCGGEKEEGKTQPKPFPDAGDYTVQLRQSQLGRAEVFTITPEAFQKQKAALVGHTLSEITLPASHETRAFTLPTYGKSVRAGRCGRASIFLGSPTTAGQAEATSLSSSI
jgi:hypothetical protein